MYQIVHVYSVLPRFFLYLSYVSLHDQQTFLEDDQIAHAQAAALKEAEILQRNGGAPAQAAQAAPAKPAGKKAAKKARKAAKKARKAAKKAQKAAAAAPQAAVAAKV